MAKIIFVSKLTGNFMYFPGQGYGGTEVATIYSKDYQFWSEIP